MQKQTHPSKIKTKLQIKNGSLYLKKWLFFRDDLILDVDYTIKLRWQKAFVTNNSFIQKGLLK